MKTFVAAVIMGLVVAACTASPVPGPSMPAPVPAQQTAAAVKLGHPGRIGSFADGLVWVLEANNGVSLIQRIGGHTLKPVGHLLRFHQLDLNDLVVAQGSLWVSVRSGSRTPGTVERLDPSTGRVLARVKVGMDPGALTACGGSIWVANTYSASVSRIDPETGRVLATVPVGEGPEEIVCGFGSVWVASEFRANVITRIDPRTGRVVATLSGMLHPVVGDHVLWVGASEGVTQIDPSTNGVIGTPLHLTIGPSYVAAGAGVVWLGSWYANPSGPTCPPGASCPFQGTFDYRRIDVETDQMFGPAVVTDGPTQPVFGFGALWISQGTMLLHVQIAGSGTRPIAPE